MCVVRLRSNEAMVRATSSDAAPSGRLQTMIVGVTRHLGQVADEHGTVGIAGIAGDVVGHDVVARFDEVAGQGTPHIAQTDHADRRHGQCFSCSARTAWSARFAALPAGAPQ